MAARAHIEGKGSALLAPLLFLLLAACGPQIGELERGEEGRVVRAYNGDTLELDSGLRVFLAEIDAPRGEEDYASQANGELEALALHRQALLAFGGERRWRGRLHWQHTGCGKCRDQRFVERWL